jgi:hypothetical protein
MTGVPRLQHLPVPATPAGTTALALSQGGAGQREKPVTPVSAVRAIPARAERGTAWGRDEAGESTTRRDSPAAGSEAASGRVVAFSRLSSMPFMVQVLGQQAAAGRSLAALPQTSLTGHRDAALMGSDIYRRAGGEPEVLPDGATFVRLAV